MCYVFANKWNSTVSRSFVAGLTPMSEGCSEQCLGGSAMSVLSLDLYKKYKHVVSQLTIDKVE